MATTVKISDTINWAAAFLVQRPTTGVGGTANEPALTVANMIMQIILSPPFKWSWNRQSATAAMAISAGVSDYPTSLANFGWLEKATLVNAAAVAPTPPNFELELYQNLAKDGEQSRPTKIATLLDDNANSITFRLFPVPDGIYTVDLLYQKAPISASTLGTTTWAPIPDKYAFVYERGFLGQMQMMYNQQLALSNMEIFFRQLIGVSEGLTETEKNIFLADSLRSVKMQAAEIQGISQGRQART